MSTWTPTTKNTVSYTPTSKSTSGTASFLLLEDGFYLLLEDGFKLMLEQSTSGSITWTPVSKS